MSNEKQQGLAKKLEAAANVAILIAVVCIVVIFVKNYLGKNAGVAPTIAPGAQFALKNVDWHSNEKNLVFAVSTTCHYCTESAGFYRRLIEACKRDHIHTIAVLPQSFPEANAYLAGEGVVVDEIRQSSLSDLEISGTPTLLMVDQVGKVQNVWVGKLSSDKENDVITKLAP